MTVDTKTAEQKALEKEQKAMNKILDAKDENFCGFCAFDVIDQDGYKKQVKGCHLDQAPVFISRNSSGKVELTACFTVRPQSFMKVDRDNNLFMNGLIWYGAEKKSPTNLIGRIVPKSMEKCHGELQESGKLSEFSVDFEIPFLAKSNKRLAKMKFQTTEERCTHKVTGLSVELTEQDWMEWKQYKLQFWKIAKAGGGGGGGGEEDDEKDKKKEE